MTLIDSVLHLFAEKGQGLYFGEAVTETEHALQTAHLAQSHAAEPSLVAAALLHDIGHLLHGLPEDIANRNIDGHHEEAGAIWLAQHFGPAVAEPVRLHVAAKRYLCATEPNYLASLSPASRLSLELQGGAFQAEDAQSFLLNPFASAAISLRRWDDAAKVLGLKVPGLEHYRACLETVLVSQGLA